MIAMAIACRPKLLIADEPTTALDVTIRAQIIELLLELQQKENMALVLITHDGAGGGSGTQNHRDVRGSGGGDRKFARYLPGAASPVYAGVAACAAGVCPDKARLASLPGVVPGKYDRPQGCLLNPRCPYATDKCRAEEPELNLLADGRQSKCHYPLDDAGRPTL